MLVSAQGSMSKAIISNLIRWYLSTYEFILKQIVPLIFKYLQTNMCSIICLCRLIRRIKIKIQCCRKNICMYTYCFTSFMRPSSKVSKLFYFDYRQWEENFIVELTSQLCSNFCGTIFLAFATEKKK